MTFSVYPEVKSTRSPGIAARAASASADPLRPPGIPGKKFAVIVATGEGDTQLAVQVMKLGAIDFIEKPYDPDTLHAMVNAGFVHLAQGQEAGEHADIARAKIAALTPRERDVLAGLVEGKANKIIAHNLDISPRTVEVYRSNLMDKLAVKSLPAALRVAFTAGMIPLAF
jgi:two-component system response regulator FixJ